MRRLTGKHRLRRYRARPTMEDDARVSPRDCLPPWTTRGTKSGLSPVPVKRFAARRPIRRCFMFRFGVRRREHSLLIEGHLGGGVLPVANRGVQELSAVGMSSREPVRCSLAPRLRGRGTTRAL